MRSNTFLTAILLLLFLTNIKSFSQNFITGIKLQNTDAIQELNLKTFEIAHELGVDYVLVPVTYAYRNETGLLICRHDTINNTWDWVSGLNYDSIFSLANAFNIKILPAFYKLGGIKDKNYSEYANFVKSFLSEFYSSGRIKYIEFQNEPVKGYDGFVSHRFNGTPTDLRLSNNAAYDSVKTMFPGIIIGTAGFITSAVSISENTIMNNYYNEYFGADSDTLKYDVLTLHHYPRNGSYFQTCTETINMGELNFMSEASIYQSYRNLLNASGHNNKPILITEGCFDLPFLSDSLNSNWLTNAISSILLIEKYLLAIRNQNLKIIGSFVSNIESKNNAALFSYNQTTGVVTKTNKFYTYKQLLKMIKKYPVYEACEHGCIDSTGYIVDRFADSIGNNLRVAFCPIIITTILDGTSMVVTDTLMVAPQIMEINITNSVNFVNITSVSNNTINTQTLPNPGHLQYSLTELPIFIEDSINTTGIAENRSQNTISIYPNPCNSIVTLQLPYSNCQIKIIDISGNVVFEKNLNSQQETLNLNLLRGMYLYQLKNSKQFISSGKLIIQ